jgi:hypothetical protein
MSELARVEKVSDKEFKVFIGDHEIGTAKSDVDARFHMHAINKAIKSVSVSYEQEIADQYQW